MFMTQGVDFNDMYLIYKPVPVAALQRPITFGQVLKRFRYQKKNNPQIFQTSETSKPEPPPPEYEVPEQPEISKKSVRFNQVVSNLSANKSKIRMRDPLSFGKKLTKVTEEKSDSFEESSDD